MNGFSFNVEFLPLNIKHSAMSTNLYYLRQGSTEEFVYKGPDINYFSL